MFRLPAKALADACSLDGFPFHALPYLREGECNDDEDGRDEVEVAGGEAQ